MMTKLLVVFGATGQQGGSVIKCVLHDPELSRQYRIRAVTRDPSKPAAQALQQEGVDLVQGDVDDAASIQKALENAHTVFAVTLTVYDDQIKTREIAQGKALADVAVAAGVQYFIYSTVPYAGRISNGKYQHVDQFDSKAEVEEYIRTLPLKSSFFAPGSFMQNFRSSLAPRPVGDGTYAISSFVKPQTQIPLIEVAADSGKYVGAILADPEKYVGKVFSAASAVYTFEEIARIISDATGKVVKYNQLSESVYRSFLPSELAEHIVQMWSYIQDFGYYGPETKDLVDWTARNARGRLTTFDEYVRDNIHLE